MVRKLPGGIGPTVTFTLLAALLGAEILAVEPDATRLGNLIVAAKQNRLHRRVRIFNMTFVVLHSASSFLSVQIFFVTHLLMSGSVGRKIIR